MLDRISFLFGEAMVALRRNGNMAYAAISTVAISLFLIGGLGYLYLRASAYANTIPGKFEMRVILKQGTDNKGIQDAIATIRAIPGVAAVTWIPKDKAWAKEQKDNPELTKGLDNPYPDAFKVTIKDLGSGDEVAGKIQSLATVDPAEGVKYLKDEQRLIDELLRLLKWLGGAVGGLLFATAGVLIYNAIRLTVVSRRLEIRIMQLVGASRFTIHVPFIIEGIVQGTVGGFVATLMIAGGNHILGRFIGGLSNHSTLPDFPFTPLLAILCLTGAVYGMLCSELAIRTPLKYR